MSYKHETGYFNVPVSHDASADKGKQLKLYYQCWIPSNAKPGYNLVIQHGVGEHSGRYGNILGALEGTGITIYSYDERGHGQSEGRRGLAKDLQQLADDLSIFLDFIEKEHKVSKPICYGHSMGGAIVLTFLSTKANQDRCKAVVATGPPLAVDPNCYQTVMKGLLSCLRHLVPSVTAPSGLDVNNLSHDKNYVEAYNEDPLNHDKIAVSLAFDLLDGGRQIIESAPNMTLPILLLHGEEDKICSPRGTKMYYEKCASKKKTLKLYPGLVHEIHNEIKDEREKVLADVKAFILEQME